jgi:hypothetical protein
MTVTAGIYSALVQHRSGVCKSRRLVGGFVSLTHGTNDAQKTMGVIALALLAARPGEGFHVPLWVIATAAAAMGAGTYAGGCGSIRALSQPPQGFAAETTTATILYLTRTSASPSRPPASRCERCQGSAVNCHGHAGTDSACEPADRGGGEADAAVGGSRSWDASDMGEAVQCDLARSSFELA